MTGSFEDVGMHRSGHEFWSPTRRLLPVGYDLLDHPHPYTLMVPSTTANAQAVQATGLVELRRGHRVVAGSTSGDQATLAVDGPHGRYEERAAWAVGADGARSTVFRALGIGQRWRDYGTDSAFADVEMDYRERTDRSRIVLDPRRPCAPAVAAVGRAG